MKTIYLLGVAALLSQCRPSQEEQKRAPESAAYTPPPAALSTAEKEKYTALVEAYFDPKVRRNCLNGGILVAKNGVVLYEKYCGLKNPHLKDSITAETPMQIASTSKPFTSAAVLLLVQQGKISLSDTLGKFFPGFPYPELTVKMLLAQRSGLPEYLYFFEKAGWDRRTFATNDDVVNALINWKPGRAFRANSRFDYCNTNFVLLASIVEKVSGLPFPIYMKRYIFDPLHMNNTYVKTVSDSTQSLASFQWNGQEWAQDFSDGTYGDKNVYSTPRDLLKWDQALYTNQLLSQPMLDSAFTPYSHEKKSLHNYGLGWRLLVYPSGKKVVYHNGRWHGFNSAFSRLVDEKVTIILLNNKFNKGVYKVARDAYNIFGPYAANATGDVE